MFRVFSAPLSATFRLDHLAAGAWHAGEEIAWLEGNGGPPQLAWDSLVAFGPPLELIETRGENPFTKIQRVLSRKIDISEIESSFHGGGIGYIGYECGRFFERIPTAPERIFDLPDCRMFFPQAWVAKQKGKEPSICCIVDGDARAGLRGLDAARTHALRLELLGSQRRTASTPEAHVAALWSRERYLLSAAWVIQQIGNGEIYQANLSQPFVAADTADPFDVYLRLLERNPSPFSAFLGFGNFAIVSASPELFLRRRGQFIETRPIKGTRPRTGNLQIDNAAILELESSEKDAAELAMIVDLERNDLSRVCEPGSVNVARAREIESYATVFHGVATVEGKLQNGIDTTQLLKATFPGGSITGCPKIRAVELLNEVEHEARGVNFGAIGWIQWNGDLDLNVAIRTLSFRRDTNASGAAAWNCSFRTGGGIVAESDPRMEYDESFAKARALANALGDSQFPNTLSMTAQK
ncbi:MAG: anthranilate synthase component I family protein [Planctomycetota bacterium]